MKCHIVLSTKRKLSTVKKLCQHLRNNQLLYEPVSLSHAENGRCCTFSIQFFLSTSCYLPLAACSLWQFIWGSYLLCLAQPVAIGTLSSDDCPKNSCNEQGSANAYVPDLTDDSVSVASNSQESVQLIAQQTLRI